MALTISVAEIVEKSKNPLLAKHESWSRVLLGEIATIQNGFAFKSSLFTKDDAIPLIRIRDVGKDQTETNYNGEYDPSYIVKKGDLLVGMDGDFNCDRWRGQRGLLNQRVCRIKLTSDMYHPKLLDYALPGYLKAINDNTSSVTVKHLSSKSIAEIPLPLPPMEQQKFIVAEIEKQFSRLDEAVANLKRVKANLKRYKASVLKAAVEGKLTEEWRKQHPDVEHANELLKRILAERRKKWEENYIKKYVGVHGHTLKDDSWKKKYKEPASSDISNLPELPKGWVWVIFLHLISANKNSIKRGPFGSAVKKAFFVNKGYKVYEQQNAIYNNPKLGDYYIDEEKYNELIDFTVNPGDFIVSCSGTIGKIAEIPESAEKGIINQALLKISIDKKVVLSKYFLYLFKSDGFQRSFLKDTRGTAMKNIASVEDIKNIPVALPSIKEQAVIVDEIESRLSVAEEMEAAIEISLKRAVRLRQSILKKAFSGELVESCEQM